MPFPASIDPAELKQRLASPAAKDLGVAIGTGGGLLLVFVLVDTEDYLRHLIDRQDLYNQHEILLVLAAVGVGAFAFALRRVRELSREMQRRIVAAERRATRLALHDSLTGLPNRRLFEDRLRAVLARARRKGELAAVIMFDLDRFKAINDVHGHKTGDLLLQAVADRISLLLREQDTVARFGGDEFAVIQTGIRQPLGILRLARRLIGAMEEPFSIDGHSVAISLSAGIALFPEDGSDVAQLIRRADIALYRAKVHWRAGFCFFEHEMDAQLQERAAIERDLKQAIAADQIQVFYQPIVSLSDGGIIGFEALARWHHPERGPVSPETFIQAAEDCGQISALCEGVLRRACRDALSWPAEMTLAVNVSPLQFRNRRLADDILAVLRNENFPPQRLEIELTENALIKNPRDAARSIAKLKGLGVQLALDDFGTGYSSLAHLRDLPFDKVKIDRSFVGTLERNADGAAIVRAIIALCSSLGLPTVAEGIESEGQRTVLARQGCLYGQGFLFGRPMATEEVRMLLSARTAEKRAPVGGLTARA